MIARKILFEYHTPRGQVIQVVHGDLTHEPVEAIINAANNHLHHGGGVAGAIVRAGGQSIQQESTAWVTKHGLVPTGGAAITGAGRLPCRYIIHAVGPIWHGQDEDDELLARAVTSALELADQYRLASVSLPGISTGIFGFPKERGARIIIRTVNTIARNTAIRQISLTNIDRKTAAIFCAAAQEILR